MSAPASTRVVVPGETVLRIPESGQLRLGPGLVNQDEHIVALKSGVLRQTKSGQTWLEGRQKRYAPAEGDIVVGTITDRIGENFMVDIGGPFIALLPQLSFEGATRRNRPNLKTGDVVCARVMAAPRDMEPQLSCVDQLGRAAGYGHLKEGIIISVSTAMARSMLASPPPAVLAALGASLQFEMAVGLNGRVWVCGSSTNATILVANAITSSEFLTPSQQSTLVSRLVAQVQ